MADLAEYPIVVLENDAPEQVGKVGLFDFLMPVGATGLVFVAAVPGTLTAAGPRFTELVQHVANLRAATTLVQMGLIRGESFAFIREALQTSIQELAESSGVDASTVVGWETNASSVPFNAWAAIATRACLADGRAMPSHHALSPDWRPRLIRVFPNVPSRGTPQPNSNQGAEYPQYSTQLQLFPGAECYPPPLS